MSEPHTIPPPRRPIRYTVGQMIVIVLGIILLLPGLCSLVVMIGAVPWNMSDPFFSLVASIWIICLLIAAGGATMIYAARKSARKPR